MSRFRAWLQRIRLHFQIIDTAATARRYFVIGAFDGALTILGVVIGAASVAEGGDIDTRLVVAVGLVGGIALAVSSTVGAFEAERIQLLLDHQILERAMLRRVEGTRKDHIRISSTISALVHGLSPIIGVMIPLSPFIFFSDLSPIEALELAVILTSVFLFALGAYLGSLIKEMILYTGLRFVIAGLATAIVLFLLGGHV